jgi:hypothetical protein
MLTTLTVFVPNNDDCNIRHLRIHRAIYFGATWANEWYDDVTHIVVFGVSDVAQVSKAFVSGKIPVGVVNANLELLC